MFVLFALACRSSSPAFDVTETWQDATVPAELHAAFEEGLDTTGADGISYAVLRDGVVVYAGGVGYRDAANGLPMEAETLVRGASTMKMQTATAVLTEVAQGGLSLQDPLSEHLPAFTIAGGGQDATLHQVLSHQGGFLDYLPIDGPRGDDVLDRHAHNVFGANYWTWTAPGTFFNYSNPNFSMAALALETATDTPYAELMQTRVWTPLQMDRTTFDEERAAADPNHAVSQAPDWEGPGTVTVRPGAYDHGFARPAASGWTTPVDLVRFGHFLMHGHPDVLPGSEHVLLTRPHIDTGAYPDALLHYGYGVFVGDTIRIGETFRDTTIWTHDGNMPGYTSTLWVLPEEGLAIAVMANGNRSRLYPTLRKAVATLVDLPVGEQPDWSTSKAQLDAIEGVYVDPRGVGTVAVSVEDGTVQVYAPSLRASGVPHGSVLEPIFDTRYEWELNGRIQEVDFIERDGTMYLRCRTFVAERSLDRAAMTTPTDLEQVMRGWQLADELPRL